MHKSLFAGMMSIFIIGLVGWIAVTSAYSIFKLQEKPYLEVMEVKNTDDVDNKTFIN